MIRKIVNALAPLLETGLTTLHRGLDRAGDDSDPSLWRLRLSADAQLDVTSRDRRSDDHARLPTF